MKNLLIITMMVIGLGTGFVRTNNIDFEYEIANCKLDVSVDDDVRLAIHKNGNALVTWSDIIPGRGILEESVVYCLGGLTIPFLFSHLILFL